VHRGCFQGSRPLDLNVRESIASAMRPRLGDAPGPFPTLQPDPAAADEIVVDKEIAGRFRQDDALDQGIDRAADVNLVVADDGVVRRHARARLWVIVR